MTKKKMLWTIAFLHFSMLAISANLFADTSKPNFVVIFADDLGYGDLGCFGSEQIKTPNIDKMAAEGTRFTNFYAQTVCGPSRAALMTGCYPLRVAIVKNRVEVHPHLHSDEITIAEVLKDVGYVSIAIGKWDLAGHSQTDYSPNLLPTHQGFNTFFGTPTSNDRIVNLIRDEVVVEPKADMSQLTRRYTDEAIGFIQQNKETPFFVYLAHSMPHVELAVSKPFQGKSAGGLYGDVVEEIDWNVGRILQTLKEEGLDDNTYVIFTSDNGPWYFGRSKGHQKKFGKDAIGHGGSGLPLRGAKTTTWEGGLRVPCIVRAPGRVPADVECTEVASTMDLLPTFANLAGGQTPTDRVIDGHDISKLLHGTTGQTSPTEAYFFYRRTRLEAVRVGKWKLMVPTPVDSKWSHYAKATDAVAITKPMLFNLEIDASETTDVSASHPEVVEALSKQIEFARNDIGDFDRIGKNSRFFDPQPRRPDIQNSK
ncbi:Arylsulfatase A [Neorhodopirellula lusitana]|uniref:Arylsulfatase A n=1 Tax=Neorhodopirellula lusitana TaxID=445327 RepID=A0ABY1Q626_9BACT|nr:sulfatase [Neorhodopirellula lusitana]SMP58739.1 Arylsulfatase A [Neorhodopirellula lusitana]